MRTDDINALAGQRGDKKGGVAVRCDDLMANDGGKWMGLASFGGCKHLYIFVPMFIVYITYRTQMISIHWRGFPFAKTPGDVWTSFYDKVKEVKVWRWIFSGKAMITTG